MSEFATGRLGRARDEDRSLPTGGQQMTLTPGQSFYLIMTPMRPSRKRSLKKGCYQVLPDKTASTCD